MNKRKQIMGDILQVLRKRGADVLTASDEDREAWQYVLYTSDQKQKPAKKSQEDAESMTRRENCFGVYDFENDSFAVYTWRYAADEKGEYVKRWGNSLCDMG